MTGAPGAALEHWVNGCRQVVERTIPGNHGNFEETHKFAVHFRVSTANAHRVDSEPTRQQILVKDVEKDDAGDDDPGGLAQKKPKRPKGGVDAGFDLHEAATNKHPSWPWTTPTQTQVEDEERDKVQGQAIRKGQVRQGKRTELLRI